MRYKPVLTGLIFIVIIQSCAVQKLKQEGQTAYQKGNYKSALIKWDQAIEKQESKGQNAEAQVYFKAGMAAKKLGQHDKAITYLETAEYLDYSSPQLFTSLAEISQHIDNLSKEIEALEQYHKNYPEGDQIDSLTIRLFETYVESENWQDAVDLWPEIQKQAQTKASLLADYLTANKNLENDSQCDKLAKQILDQDPQNQTALKWYAFKYFWKAEDLYVKEMKAYKNNRTTSQYNRLLKKLDEVYPTFEKSRDYFLKLYELDPKPEYAKYLGNIYKRLQKEEKAKYYLNKAK